MWAALVGLMVYPLMVALQLGPMPVNAAIKLKLYVGEHGGGVPIDHVITVKALSMEEKNIIFDTSATAF